MTYENNDKKMDSVYSKRIRAGKRRTYFFDVRATKGNDYFLTITESRKRFDDNGYDRHKIFLYKEDFNKFVKAMQEAVDFVKTELMPDFDFDAFNHEYPEGESETMAADVTATIAAEPDPVPTVVDSTPSPLEDSTAVQDNLSTEEVDKW